MPYKSSDFPSLQKQETAAEKRWRPSISSGLNQGFIFCPEKMLGNGSVRIRIRVIRTKCPALGPLARKAAGLEMLSAF